MAEGTPLDLTKTVADLVGAMPQLQDLLAELGFEGADPAKTIPELAADLGVELGVVSFALEASGYDVQGYVPTGDGFESPIPDIVKHLFFPDEADELPPSAFDSASPKIARIEMAIQRAKERGEFPQAK